MRSSRLSVLSGVRAARSRVRRLHGRRGREAAVAQRLPNEGARRPRIFRAFVAIALRRCGCSTASARTCPFRR
eukprot:4712894-Pleurochrysis_carterae.AAC.1